MSFVTRVKTLCLIPCTVQSLLISANNSDKTQDAGTVITRNRYEVLSDSDEIDTNGCNNDNDKLSNNVTANISSRQVNLGNKDKKTSTWA